MKRKKSILAALVLVTVIAMCSLNAFAETATNVSVMVNNRKVISNALPAVSNGTILVAAKDLMESMGGSFTFDLNKLTGTLKKDENELVFRLDDSVVKFNGKYMQSPAALKVISNRLMVPAQFVATKFGADVYINTKRNMLMIFQPMDGKIMYQVMPGDTFWILSQLFGTSISTLKQLNNLTTDTLYVGQKLIIKNYSSFNTIYPAKTSNSATISSGAGWGYSAVGYLQAGVSISVIGKNGDWYKVITAKGNGYIYYSVISVQQEVSDSQGNSAFLNGEIPLDTSKDSVSYTNYTVQKGDTLWTIAERNGILDYELAAASNISLSAGLTIGQILTIPVHNIPVKTTLGTQYGEVLDWFKEGQYVFPINKVGKFIDLETGKSFMAKRTMGASHSDTETLTAQDTQAMKDIFGGSWTWNRKSFILQVDDRQFAVSITGMPHAGIDGVPYLKNVDNRSGNFGSGPNFDRIPGNAMNGHFDVYFLNSLRHVDNKIEAGHQYGVLVSGGLQ